MFTDHAEQTRTNISALSGIRTGDPSVIMLLDRQSIMIGS
jgi:hypothetical protein